MTAETPPHLASAERRQVRSGQVRSVEVDLDAVWLIAQIVGGHMLDVDGGYTVF